MQRIYNKDFMTALQGLLLDWARVGVLAREVRAGKAVFTWCEYSVKKARNVPVNKC
jgi:hypothetical protein